MPVKIGFQVIASTGEDEKFRATELNYHGPTVRGWRSSANCIFPQEIILQLKVLAILHQIQILAHQYLIPQKIEICTSNKLDSHSPSQNPADLFEYLGFITFSDNKATGFRSRELKSILIPSKRAKYIKLRIHSNHENVKNIYNQVGLMAVNILGDEVYNKNEESELNNNFCFRPNSSVPSTVVCNSHYISPYDDLAFEMYVDQETAKIIKIIEYKKLQAVFEERFDYANTLKIALDNLRVAGEILGLYEQEKRQAINFEDFDKAKIKKLQIDNFRQKVYAALHIDQLLDSTDFLDENDVNLNPEDHTTLRNEDVVEQLNQLPPNDHINRRVTPNNDNLDLSDLEYDRSPLKKLDRISQNNNGPPAHIIHSKSQTSFSEHNRNSFSQALFKSQTFSTSTSNPQLHLFLQEAHSRSYSQINSKMQLANKSPTYSRNTDDIEERLEDIKTPSSASYSSGPLSPTASYERSDVVRGINDSMIPQGDVEISLPGMENDLLSTPKKYTNWSETIRQRSSPENTVVKQRMKVPVSEQARPHNKLTAKDTKTSFEAYEDRMLPALRSYHGNEIVRECQLALEPTRKSTLNEREKKQAILPISVFGIEMIEKFYSKNFSEKEEGLKLLQQELKKLVNSVEDSTAVKQPSFNKIARAAIFLLHRTLRDKVYSVYSCAAETVRLFFTDFVPQRVSPSEVARSVEKLLPELLTKSGDVTPRIHNLAAHTILSMAECEEVRRLNIIPVHLSRPITSSVHPRLAQSRLEMVEQIILNQGISKDKRSGLTCRTLAEFGSSGLHHPAEAVRKVSERILIEVYKVNPRIVRKQLPPDDNVTRRNLLYRQLLQEFDFMDIQRKLNEQSMDDPTPMLTNNEANKTLSQNTTNYKSKIEDNLNGEEYSTGSLKEVKNKSNLAPTKKQSEPHSSANISEKDKTRYSAPKELNKSPLKSLKPLKKQTETVRGDCSTKNDTTKMFEGKTQDNYTSTLSIVNRKNNETTTMTLKFPSLTDSIEATKARMLFESKKNLKKKPECSSTKGDTVNSLENAEPKLSNGCLVKKEIKRDSSNHSLSSIPIPTFGTRRKYLMNTKKTPDKDTKTQLPSPKTIKEKPNGAVTVQTKIIKAKIYEQAEEKKFLEMSEMKKKMLQNLPSNKISGGRIVYRLENNIEQLNLLCKRKVRIDESNKFSSSVLASLKENEYLGNYARADNDEVPGKLRKCIFCLSSKWTTEDGLNSHYLKDCPMLTTCEFCTEITEISGFTNHLLGDCDQRQLFQKCNNCQEALLKDLYKNHECTASQSKIQKTRCPFCHTDIGDDDSNWRSHLMGTNICPNHPRPQQNGLAT